MEIDLANPTAEQIAELKKAIPGLSGKLGILAIDPDTPLDRETMGKLKIKYKADGEEHETDVWDASQAISLRSSASKDKTEAKKLRDKVNEFEQREQAMQEWREALKNGKLPSDDVIAVAADQLGVTTKDIKDQFNAAPTKPDTKPTPGSPELDIDDLVDKLANHPKFSRRILSDYQADHLNGEITTKADAELKAVIDEKIQNNPTLAKIREDAKGSERETSVLKDLEEIVKGTVYKQARGRIAEIVALKEDGDIVGEIPDIVTDVIKPIDIKGHLAKLTPQPIVLGGSGDTETITISSEDKPREDLDTTDPDFVAETTKGIMQTLATAVSSDSD